MGLAVAAALAVAAQARADDDEDDADGRERTLYVWAGDQARARPDFLAVVDFDERSPRYGQVLRTVPLPPPGDVGNEPHHCHLSADRRVLACGGLLSVLSGQASIFFFDVTRPRHPRFLSSTSAARSAITDDFLPLARRTLLRTVPLPEASGAMDVKLIPRDARGRAVTAGMFSGLVYTVDPLDGSVVQAFDCETIVPHVEVPVRGGMVQLLAMPRSGDRLLFASFQAGQVGMLDIADRTAFRQLDVVSLGPGAGPHAIGLTADDARLVVVDYFLDEDAFGKVHFEGDHRVRVLRVGRDRLELDGRFQLDFDTAFPSPARPHGFAMK